jgi:hypothetical protein
MNIGSLADYHRFASFSPLLFFESPIIPSFLNTADSTLTTSASLLLLQAMSLHLYVALILIPLDVPSFFGV